MSIYTQLNSVLQTYNSINYSLLEDALPQAIRKNFFKEFNVNNKDFLEFYSWKNGYDPDINPSVRCQIFYIETMLSLDWIHSKLRINKEMGTEWDGIFIPILGDDTGEYILFNNKKGRHYGKLYFVSPSIIAAIKPISCYDSITSMIQTTICAYEKGIMYYDQTRQRLKTDIDNYFSIAKIFNPNSLYWSR